MNIFDRDDEIEKRVLTNHTRPEEYGGLGETWTKNYVTKTASYDELEVGLPLRTSEDIEDDLCRALAVNGQLDASHIDVEAIGDEVHLRGEVLDRPSRSLAEKLASEIIGVNHVINQLKLREEKNIQKV
jgi:osmotically-inducible protein OsmY